MKLSNKKAGAFSLLVEAVPPEVCRIIRDELTIPVYSIGAGIAADGQLMIVSDILGIFRHYESLSKNMDPDKNIEGPIDPCRRCAFWFPEVQHIIHG
jgi:ketopantoate hydroxymethyltransferase